MWAFVTFIPMQFRPASKQFCVSLQSDRSPWPLQPAVSGLLWDGPLTTSSLQPTVHSAGTCTFHLKQPAVLYARNQNTFRSYQYLSCKPFLFISIFIMFISNCTDFICVQAIVVVLLLQYSSFAIVNAPIMHSVSKLKQMSQELRDTGY